MDPRLRGDDEESGIRNFLSIAAKAGSISVNALLLATAYFLFRRRKTDQVNWPAASAAKITQAPCGAQAYLLWQL